MESGELDFRRIPIAYDLQLLDRRHNRETGFKRLVCRLREITHDIQSGFLWDTPLLTVLLRARHTTAGVPLVALVGASESGKPLPVDCGGDVPPSPGWSQWVAPPSILPTESPVPRLCTHPRHGLRPWWRLAGDPLRPVAGYSRGLPVRCFGGVGR